MVRGYGRKEKVAQLVDKSTGVVDKKVNACLTISAPFRTNALKRLRWQALWGGICAIKAQKKCAIFRLLIAPIGAGSARDKGRVLSYAVNFLSIYWLRV